MSSEYVFQTRVEGLSRSSFTEVNIPNLCRKLSMIPSAIVFSGVPGLEVRLSLDGSQTVGVFTPVYFDHTNRIDLSGMSDQLHLGGNLSASCVNKSTDGLARGIPVLTVTVYYVKTIGMILTQLPGAYGAELTNFFFNRRTDGLITNLMIQTNVPLQAFKLVPIFQQIEDDGVEPILDELIVPFENKEIKEGQVGSRLRLDFTSGSLADIRDILSMYRIECVVDERYSGRDLVAGMISMGFKKF